MFSQHPPIYPFIVYYGLPITVVLTVIDAAGDTARDTTVVQTAVFHSAVSAIPTIHHIEIGDSTFIEGNIQLGGSFKPYTVVWRPTAAGLRDTTAGGTWQCLTAPRITTRQLQIPSAVRFKVV